MSLPYFLLPAPQHAFPTGWHDRLIKAAILPDDGRALEHAEAWLRANDIDHASFRYHRLLVAVAARFGQRLDGHAAYPRLVGLRRMLWTRSLIALREAKPTLGAIARAGVEMLLFKGAARLADGGHERAERVAHDIDIVVRPEQMWTTFDILIDHGWIPAQGVSEQYVREHLTSTRGINMFKGNFGDIDLHARPFHPGQGVSRDDAVFWERSRPARLDGIDVRLPSLEDGVALSIGHGGLDAHAHSDWLVDVATTLSRHVINWSRFEEIVRIRSLEAPALIALSYLSAEAEIPIPATVLAGVARAARARPLAYISGFVQARPHDRAAIAGGAMRGIAKLFRKHAAKRQLRRAADRCLDVRRISESDAGGNSSPALEHRVVIPTGVGKGRAHFHAVLQIPAPPVRRRIELEVNGAERHVCRIRYKKWSKGDRLLTLAVNGRIKIPPDETSLKLVSRPSRLLRHYSEPSERARYDALPFRCIVLEITEDRNAKRRRARAEPSEG